MPFSIIILNVSGGLQIFGDPGPVSYHGGALNAKLEMHIWVYLLDAEAIAKSLYFLD